MYNQNPQFIQAYSEPHSGMFSQFEAHYSGIIQKQFMLILSLF